jgi:nitrogen PTS system EIIA component
MEPPTQGALPFNGTLRDGSALQTAARPDTGIRNWDGPAWGRRNDDTETMTSLFVLDPAAVGSCDAEDKQGVLEALAQRFAAVYGLDQSSVLEALEEREKLGSTGFGRGTAIPHARLDALSQPVCVFMRLATPVSFDSADGMPVELVFGLLSPEKAGAMHLHALAAISRTMRDDRMRDRLIEAPGDEAVYALLANVSERDAA